jgi:RNA polymerase sigma-70 factor (ECF subfamily)
LDVAAAMTMDMQAPRQEVSAIDLERALVARAAAGDGAAFRRLFDRHAPGVWRFLRDLLRDTAAADEGTQETFVRAHARLDTLRTGDKLAPWLFGIARNVSWEQLRARKRYVGVDDERDEDRPSPEPTPETLLLMREADQQLGAALASLGEERRAALLLRLDHGLGYEEIAGVMGWTLPKVKNEIHRARLALRSQLGEYLGDAA